MEILSKLPFDLQEHILIKVMKRYKLRDGEYVRQIDKTKYAFLDYIMRPSINKNSFHYYEDIAELKSLFIFLTSGLLSQSIKSVFIISLSLKRIVYVCCSLFLPTRPIA